MKRAELGIVFAGSLVCCGGPTTSAPQIQDTGKAVSGVQCSARSQSETDLLGWDAGSIAKLRQLSKKGVVAVRYEASGCDAKLEVLSGCLGKGATYEYQPYAEQSTRVARNAQDLYASFPLGAALLQEKLAGGRVLRADYLLVGRDDLNPTWTWKRADLEGPDCARVTHVISTIYLGGFEMAAGESRRISEAVSVFGGGAGSQTLVGVERVASAGDAVSCEEARKVQKEHNNCAVPLRIALQKLDAIPVKCLEGGEQRGRDCVRATRGMARIPAGNFRMGSDDGVDDEKPVHEVSVGAFEMDLTEVTVAAYRTCVDAGICTQPDTSRFCNWGQAERDNHPINCVDWNQATAYCAFLGKRLPTEEEWEYAARGTDGRTYPWGDAEPAGQLCWNRSDSTCPVGSFPSGDSPFGLHDMAGNVWEWTSSKYSQDYSKARVDDQRVSRGGLWTLCSAFFVRSAFRYAGDPSGRRYRLGFRCAK